MCQRQFDCLKVCIQETTLIRHYDTELPASIYVDANKTCLFAILVQGEPGKAKHPVVFASRSTWPDYVVRGPSVQVVTDHKPLNSIFADTRKSSIRTDWIKTRHQDMDCAVIWEKGESNPADYQSRQEPQRIVVVPLPYKSLQDLGIDLFGPMSDNKYVAVV